jgi:hypothetical protein
MKLTVPTDLSEITLGQLQDLNKINELKLEPIELMKRSIEILTKVDRGTLDRFRLSDLQMVYDKLLSLTKQEEKLVKFVNIEDEKYGFHPNLSNISTGEFVDIDTLCQDLNKNLDMIMAILYRKVTVEKSGKYQIEAYGRDIESRANLFKEKMPANVVNGAILFFWTLGKDYLVSSITSSNQEAQTLSTNSLTRSGVGTLY